MGRVIKGNFSALKTFAKKVGTLSMSNQMPLLKAGMAAAIRPIRDDARSRAPIGDEKDPDRGALKKSMADKVIGYSQDANVVGLVGVQKGNFGTGKKPKRPSNYAHLVEFGHRSVHGGGAVPNMGERVTGVWNSKNKGLSIRKGTIKATSYVIAKPFLGPAFESGVSGLENTLGESVATAMTKEFDKFQ